MLRIEFDEPKKSLCECCGNTTTKLTRFVYRDDNAYAVYYLRFTKGHPERSASGLIGLGEWGGEESSPEQRTAFAFELWQDENNFNVGIVDKEDSPWGDVSFLGRILDREEALKHEWIDEVFHVTDHIVTEDKEIVQFFNHNDA
jgi:hypothetical protein